LYKTYNPDICTSLGVFGVGTFEGVRRISPDRPCCHGDEKSRIFTQNWL